MNLKAEIKNAVANIEIELNKEEVAPFLDKALTAKLKDFEAPGFRKGKMPKAMFLSKYSIESVYPDAIDLVLNETYPQVVVQEKLEVIASPEFDWATLEISEEGFKVVGTVDLMPTIEVEGYATIHEGVTKKRTTVTKKEVEAKINTLIENKAVIEIKEGAAVDGDIVVIDFEGFKDGVAFEGGKGDNYPLTLGSNSFIPGFEEQLIGCSAEEEREVNVTFPEDYQAEDLAGAEVVFKCTVHEVKAKVLPELTDELVAELQNYEANTVADLEKAVKAEIKDAKTKENQNNYANEIIEKLIASANFEAPKSMVREETEHTLNNFKQQIAQQGMEFEMYIQMLGMTEEAIRTDIDRESKRKVEEMLVLDAIVKKENFEFSDEEAEAKIEELAKNANMEIEAVKQAIGDMDRLKRDMAFDRAYKLVLGE